MKNMSTKQIMERIVAQMGRGSSPLAEFLVWFPPHRDPKYLYAAFIGAWQRAGQSLLMLDIHDEGIKVPTKGNVIFRRNWGEEDREMRTSLFSYVEYIDYTA
jgi:hypothetical protein